MKIVINNVSNVVKFCTLKPGDVFMIKNDPEEAVFIRTSADVREDGNALDLSNGELSDIDLDEEVIPHPDASLTLNV